MSRFNQLNKNYLISLIFFLLSGFSSFSFSLSGFISSYSAVNTCFGTREAACSANLTASPNYSVGYTNFAGLGGADGTRCNVQKVPNTDGGVNYQTFGCSKTCTSGQVLGQSGSCEVAAACSGGTVNASNVCVCPVNATNVGGVCTYPPCPTGQVRDATSHECVWVSSCPSGQSLLTTKSSGGTQTGAYCVEDAPEQNCRTYADLQTVACQDAKKECEAGGGTFGYGGAAGSEHNVCIPPEVPLPACAAGQIQFETKADGSKSPTCMKPYDPNPTGVTTNTLPSDPAATQNANIANNTAAIAGILQSGLEGVVNAINAQGKNVAGSGSGSGTGDEAPCTGDNCKNSETKHSASGGDGCDAPPSCDGDQIMCTALKVSWQSKCAISKTESTEVADGLRDAGIGESDKPGWTSFDVASQMSSVLNQSGSAGVCPSAEQLHLSYGNFGMSFSMFCEIGQQLRAFVLLLFAFMSVRIVFGARAD